MVKVASFTRYDMRTDKMVTPPFKKLTQSLRPEDGYVMIEGTAEDVPLEHLDAEGRYFPRRSTER